ncbi:MAG: hypothetical protein J6K26_02720 [Lachnospiraceae bacterium]|nr:hypothetical protein [Lachnospiraceae bacterium]
MRVYSEQNKDELIAVKCNACGKKLLVEHGIVKEGIYSCQETFGYFSNKDGQVHSFDLCESCYDKMTGEFRIPVEIEEAREIL